LSAVEQFLVARS